MIILSVFGEYLIFVKLYSREIKLRLSPLLEDSHKDTTHVKYWFIGDSRIVQWDIPDSILDRTAYINFGIDGQTTAQVLYRLRLYFEKNNPDYVFIQVGINDLKAIGLFPTMKRKIIEQCELNIKHIISETINHNVVPIYISIISPGNIEWIRRPIWNNDINHAVIEVNNNVIKFALSKNIPIIDTSVLCSDNKFVTNWKYQKDCLHLNANGYSVLNKELNKVISDLANNR